MASTTAISRTGSRLPMTTPFAIPSICTGNFNSTTTITKTYAAYESVTVRLFDVAPDAEACHYGQAPKPTARHLALGFSPAVCPSAWTAYSLEMDPLGRGKARQSFAWCCPSGFEPYGDSPDLGAACLQSVPPQNGSDRFPRTTTQRLATAWHITWAASDTKTLSPAPPSLDARCTGAEIRTWVPGAPVTEQDRECRVGEHGGFLGSSLFWFLAFGLPLIVVTLPCMWCCCVKPMRKKKREQRAREEREADARAAREVGLATQEVHESIPATQEVQELSPETEKVQKLSLETQKVHELSGGTTVRV